jgi:hypothetical protein
VRAFSHSADEAVDMANALAEAYREERNNLWPPPPGCQSVAARIAERAQPEARATYFLQLFRGVLGGILMGVAVAFVLSAKSNVREGHLLPYFLTWFSFLFAVALLVPSLDVPTGLTAALLIALLMTTAAGCIDWAGDHNVPVSARFLHYAFGLACMLLMGWGVFEVWVLKPMERTTTRVRVGVVDQGAGREVPLTYDRRFLKTEEALIESDYFSKHVVEKLGVKRVMEKNYPYELIPQQAAYIVNSRLSAETVKGTSLIDLHYSERFPADGVNANDIAELYQDFWQERSPRQPNHEVRVAAVEPANSTNADARRTVCGYLEGLLKGLYNSLLVLTGAIVTVVVARKPVHLYRLLGGFLLYFITLGLLWMASESPTRPAFASSLVRVWPSELSGLDGTRPRPGPPNHRNSLLAKESAVAVSREVLTLTLEALMADYTFKLAQDRQLHDMGRYEREHWIAQRLEVIPVGNSFLMKFIARADNPGDATRISAVAAEQYCAWRLQTAEQDEADRKVRGAETLGEPVRSANPRDSLNPIVRGLASVLGQVGWLAAGAGIGYLGFLIGKDRDSKTTGEPSREGDATGESGPQGGEG